MGFTGQTVTQQGYRLRAGPGAARGAEGAAAGVCSHTSASERAGVVLLKKRSEKSARLVSFYIHGKKEASEVVCKAGKLFLRLM